MAESEKIENLLSLSLSATPMELRQSPALAAGMINMGQQEPVWEVIVKYNGSIAGLADENIKVEELIAGYAIITLPESLIPLLAKVEQIEYMEKPKLLYPGDVAGNFSACIVNVTANEPYLTGKGVLVAVIDSGIDYYNEAFRNPDGTTRIDYLYDQSLGQEFSAVQINEALRTGSRQEALRIVPSRDVTGHGTAVCSIAAGNAQTVNGQRTIGVATQSRLLIVKLDTGSQNSFPMTTNLMRAFTYVVKKAQEMGMPVAINLSFGNTYGSHNGASLVERFLNNISEIGRCVICVGSGNEGASSGHTSGTLSVNEERVEFAVGEFETNLNLQLWKSYSDIFQIQLIHPSGSMVEIDIRTEGTKRYELAGEEILVYVGFPKPYSVLEEIYMNLLPQGTYLTSGVWQIVLKPIQVKTGEYHIYMPSQTVRNLNTRFFIPTPERTLTIPATSERVITVGAYDAVYNSYAPFSGRGYVEQADRILGPSKPDLVAPGVGILAISATGLQTLSGTSFAAPFVTGAAALLMEWGIERENDIYLYGERLKACLLRGAKPLPGFSEYPNPAVGWGALCLADSLLPFTT